MGVPFLYPFFMASEPCHGRANKKKNPISNSVQFFLVTVQKGFEMFGVDDPLVFCELITFIVGKRVHLITLGIPATFRSVVTNYSTFKRSNSVT